MKKNIVTMVRRLNINLARNFGTKMVQFWYQNGESQSWNLNGEEYTEEKYNAELIRRGIKGTK